MQSLDLFQETPVSLDNTSAARRFLFRDSFRSESSAEIVRWWEKRRLPFNLIVGATGLISLSAIGLANLVFRGGFFDGPAIIAVGAYAIAANVCYTAGWCTELLLRPVFGPRTGTVGAAIFRYGLAFSVGLTLLPAVISSVGVAARLLVGLFS